MFIFLVNFGRKKLTLMSISKGSFYRLVFFLSLFPFLISCEKDDEKSEPETNFPTVDKGDIVVKDLYLVFHKSGSAVKDTFYYNSLNSKTADTIHLKEAVKYEARVYFLDQNGKDVSSDIHKNEENYIVCYSPTLPTGLKLDDISKDKNDKKIGILTKWTAAKPTDANNNYLLNVTLNYQALEKENFCSPGVRLIDANFIYEIKQ